MNLLRIPKDKRFDYVFFGNDLRGQEDAKVQGFEEVPDESYHHRDLKCCRKLKEKKEEKPIKLQPKVRRGK